MKDASDVALYPLGDGAVWAERPAGVPGLDLSLALRELAGVLDVVVTEDRFSLSFAGGSIPPGIAEAVRRAGRSGPRAEPREHTFRVRYDGLDLEEVAGAARLSKDAFAELHAGRSYEVRMLGFLPGFAYLGDLDARLVVPRRPVPRPRIDAGALAVASHYTGIYPLASPGGWNVIGHQVEGPRLFDPGQGALLRLADRVRFERIA